MKSNKEIKRPTLNSIREELGMKRIDLKEVQLVQSYSDHIKNLNLNLPERRN